MTETDDHGGRGEIDRLIRSPVLDDLETAYGVKCAFSACDVGGFRLGCVRLEDDPDKPVALIVPDGKDWRVVARFEWSPPALRAIGLLLDEHWDEVPVDWLGHPSPTLVIACEQALEVVYRTSEGVRDGRELFDEPGSVNHIERCGRTSGRPRPIWRTGPNRPLERRGKGGGRRNRVRMRSRNRTMAGPGGSIDGRR